MMQKLEKFLIALSAIGAIIKLFFNGGGDILLLVGMTLLGSLYLIFGFAILNDIGFREIFIKGSYVEVNVRRIVLSAAFGIAFFGMIFGILFRLLNFEGAFELLALSLVVAFILFIILIYRYHYQKITIATYYKNVMYRLVPYSLIGLFMIVEIIYNYYYGSV
ncbi:MAG: hypothetical protein ACNS60_12275 [Candidatus Cyclobacteriaceae bacterium M2_1C_046]